MPTLEQVLKFLEAAPWADLAAVGRAVFDAIDKRGVSLGEAVTDADLVVQTAEDTKFPPGT
jgi:hypothetical protein